MKFQIELLHAKKDTLLWPMAAATEYITLPLSNSVSEGKQGLFFGLFKQQMKLLFFCEEYAFKGFTLFFKDPFLLPNPHI